MSGGNRQGQVMAEPHPDCAACRGERVTAERIVVANGLLRIEVMDLIGLIRNKGHLRELCELYRDRPTERDIMGAPTCTHGRALHAFCRRCDHTVKEEDCEIL